MKKYLKQVVILFIAFIMLSGCATKTSEYYFDSSENSNGWTYKFIPGKNDTKVIGYPDSVLFTLNNSEYKLNLRVLSYQLLDTVGPIIIPIVPVFDSYNGFITISLDLKSEKSLDLNTQDWTLVNLETNQNYKVEKVATEVYGKSIGKKINKAGRFFITFPVKASDVTHFKLEFGSIKVDNTNKEISPLFFQKKKGKNRFSQFSI